MQGSTGQHALHVRPACSQGRRQCSTAQQVCTPHAGPHPPPLQAKRAEFWETQPYYGGSKEIWTALKAACSAEDMETTKLILEAAGVIVSKSDLSVCYDERGAG